MRFIAGLSSGIIAALLAAQDVPELKFEVAAIERNVSNLPLRHAPELHHGALSATNSSLREILQQAYGLEPQRVIGPAWMDSQRFDIQAKAPEGVADNQMRPMLRTLLKERFGLVAHKEAREMGLYALVVARGGPKMAVYPASERPLKGIATSGFPMIRGTMTTAQLATALSNLVERPVMDKTGLHEKYNLVLSFLRPASQVSTVPDAAPPEIFKAIEEQLGLELVATKGKVDVVVVDRLNKNPTEN